MSGDATVAILGLGYVGLPLALAFAENGRTVIGYDIDAGRTAELACGVDRNDPEGGAIAVPPELRFTAEAAELAGAEVFILAVPTPIDSSRRPDLGPLAEAARAVGGAIRPGGLVIVESTVHPGATEEVVGHIVAEVSGLAAGTAFKLGYSPERINPGDTTHGLGNVVKVVSGQDAETLARVVALYEPVVPAGLHAAPSIKVAEASKITENIQRDVNIALMNELAQVYDRLGLRTEDVLAAARTKWNFAPYTPGLVGGHCIGVDPYYLIAKAEAHGYYPELIRSARRLNDTMSERIVEKTVMLLGTGGTAIAGARVGVMGVAFKENVSDARNSQVPPIVAGLSALGAQVYVADPLVGPAVARRVLGIELVTPETLTDLDVLILASPHRAFLDSGASGLGARLRPGGLLVDIKSVLIPADLPPGLRYWSL
ncbi:nucleotide sugar dehydrogenase [Thalassobaculum litoreum]|uniref:UDP-N-acetyl-D-galactosamine dehydrogenase n=1 Tax=Thalassobaculum litoreum DSM 18839 TaxID=1123362 RepID=A0A8G2BIT2_9PROT|nr:nucleotide sugar dehydrogenase [Thalassobaculum litoreum]SDF57875.1 UDP-N-acetyl-D-galactosamine dehydrogenase [Thalassobaculum litoreum DSM 18839]